MSAPISMDKQYRTRDGRKVRVLCVDYKGQDPVIAIAINADGTESAGTHKADGRWNIHGDHPRDLIEVKPKRVAWVNVYEDFLGGPHQSRSAANEDASVGRIACIRVEYEEGQFDEEPQS